MIVLLLAIVLLMVVLGWLVVLVVSERRHLRERTELLDRAHKAATRADELLEAFNRQLEQVSQSVHQPEAGLEHEQLSTRIYSGASELLNLFPPAPPFGLTSAEFAPPAKRRLYGVGASAWTDFQAFLLHFDPDIESAKLDMCLSGAGTGKSRRHRQCDLEAAARRMPWARGFRGNGGVRVAS